MRPSFVFILADDLGYADLGCYGGRSDCSQRAKYEAWEKSIAPVPVDAAVNIPLTRADLAHPG